MDFDALVCDLDGVIYRGDEAIAGSAEAIAGLRARGVKVVFCTNNSRATVADYIDKLAGFEIEAEPEDIVTSALVTAEALKERGLAGHTAIVVGGQGIKSALGDVCISVKDDPDVTVADLVVVGWALDFTYADLRRAAQAVNRGARLIATNDDASYPAPEGLWPGTGAILAAIETATGATAEVMGKPHTPMMDAVARRLEGAERIAIAGDRADTDLAGGAARGWLTILVLSGVTTAADVAAIDPAPDLVVGSLAELIQ